jgi:hypothetical protein
MWPFLSSASLPTKLPVTLTSSRRRNSQRRRRWLIFLLLVPVAKTTSIIVARTVTTIKVTNAITMKADTTVAIEMISVATTLIAKRRTSRKVLQEER